MAHTSVSDLQKHCVLWGSEVEKEGGRKNKYETWKGKMYIFLGVKHYLVGLVCFLLQQIHSPLIRVRPVDMDLGFWLLGLFLAKHHHNHTASTYSVGAYLGRCVLIVNSHFSGSKK